MLQFTFKTLFAASCLLYCSLFLRITQAYSHNGLNNVPQMGWNNWNAFGCSVSDDLLLNTAQRLADTGLRDLGYKYIVLDDCWSKGRDEHGRLVSDGE